METATAGQKLCCFRIARTAVLKDSSEPQAILYEGGAGADFGVLEGSGSRSSGFRPHSYWSVLVIDLTGFTGRGVGDTAEFGGPTLCCGTASRLEAG